MTLLVGRRAISGGVYWQVTRPDAPGVLVMVFPEQVATDAAVLDVSLPEIGREEWRTVDFDALREHLEPQPAAHLPGWAWGWVRATPADVGPSVCFEVTSEMVGASHGQGQGLRKE
jgi:hypothetical protein